MMNQRLHITIRGAVQGVGFRPFVYRLAQELGLRGYVTNTLEGVVIDSEGPKEILDKFLLRVQKDCPPPSFIQTFNSVFLDSVGYDHFEIRKSEVSGATTVLVMPDIATCRECMKEIFDPTNRRFRYPFTNCTHCGPRFSIITGLPYDRPQTTMTGFVMCSDCLREYENPADRRFHAQPNACPVCGPHLELWNARGNVLACHDDALCLAAESICRGNIVALKGIGGFQFIVDARNNDAVSRLRERKHRQEKPLAVMVSDINAVHALCNLNECESQFLRSPQAPIVLLKRLSNTKDSAYCIAPSVAPNNPYLGVMLAYTPLHHVLLNELQIPIVATSGNISDEPICTDEREALERLHGIADMFLIHNRPIARHVDDSVIRLMAGRELVLRRARGYAPLPIPIRQERNSSMIALGGHLKNSIAITAGNNIFPSQHIGDMESQATGVAFENTIASFKQLYNSEPSMVVADLHPDYYSTQYARRLKIPVLQIQHHYAHVASCMAEHLLDGHLLGVAWDGTGYGTDGTIWGGEFLLIDDHSYKRAATFRQFRLPGSEQAIKEPRRSAIGLLYEIFGKKIFDQEQILPLQSCSAEEKLLFWQMLSKAVNAPLTSSAGRLFDAVASIIGIRQLTQFEGQAAMELEFAIDTSTTTETYTLQIASNSQLDMNTPRQASIAANPPLIIDWSPMIHSILDDMNRQLSQSLIATKFHNTMTESIICVAKRVGEERVVLSGGCFQNVYLAERTINRLREEGFQPYWHREIPPNDGGLAVGQIYAAMRESQPSHQHYSIQDKICV